MQGISRMLAMHDIAARYETLQKERGGDSMSMKWIYLLVEGPSSNPPFSGMDVARGSTGAICPLSNRGGISWIRAACERNCEDPDVNEDGDRENKCRALWSDL
jgi:hypothetical protein